jgi:hypothetical protein
MAANAEMDRLIAEFGKKWGFSNAEADAEIEQDVRSLIAATTSPPLDAPAPDNFGRTRRRAYRLGDE